MDDNEQFLLLQLSDIHFREPYCLNHETDPEYPIRKAIINDIRDMVKILGPVKVILLSGDIAYKAHESEYREADKWLDKVCTVARCSKKDIYVVPGNHDVNRSTAKLENVQKVRAKILDRINIQKDETQIQDILHDPQTGQDLFNPMAEYNQFAASFGCDIDGSRPFWTEELQLNYGWKLKMHGLTTTLLSGPKDDISGQLFLGEHQYAFAADDGIIRLAIMHHPPEWLMGTDNINDVLWDRCAIQLLGHKHLQRYHPGPHSVRLSAGAINPDRNEKRWQPGYNYISLRVIDDSGEFFLQIESHLRIWQSSPDQFVAKIDRDGSQIFKHKIQLFNPPIITTKSDDKIQETVKCNSVPKDNYGQGTIESANSIEVLPMSQRSLVNKFWDITPNKRRKILKELGLIGPNDFELPEPQRYRLAFNRARGLNVIKKLEVMINQAFDL